MCSRAEAVAFAESFRGYPTQRLADALCAADACVALASVDLRRYPRDPAIREAVRAARVATAHAMDMLYLGAGFP